ncbi:MAG: 2-octaprenyl-6-methoxyphenyl hydroxylase [Pontibacterium sp.]
MTTQTTPDYDIVIIGGGMVGASFACALLNTIKRHQLRVAIIEASPLQASNEKGADAVGYQPSFDARATALSYGAKNIYEAMGIWDELQAGVSPIKTIHVSDRGHFGATRLHANDEGVDALGYVTENRWLGEVLLSHLNQHPSNTVDWICPAEVTELQTTATDVCLSLSAKSTNDIPTQLRASLVIMADGGRSSLREKMGIHYAQDDYQQYAVIANISPDRDHQGIAYERFTDTGPMALLPLTQQAGRQRCGLVWTVAAEEHEEIMALDDAAFIARVQARFGYRAGQFMHVGTRTSYPLKLTHAKEQVRQGVVVLGNAAHALHPIAGQGYNLALRGAASLADHIATVVEQGRPLGSLEHLQAFYDVQREDQQRTIHASDRLMKLFASRSGLIALGRDLGLQALDICSPAKTVLARAAMGIDMPAPNLRAPFSSLKNGQAQSK